MIFLIILRPDFFLNYIKKEGLKPLWVQVLLFFLRLVKAF